MGTQISGLTTRATQSFNQAWQPWLFERLKEATPSAKRRVALAFYIASVTTVVFAIALWLAVRWIYPLIIGDKYAPAVELIPWICLGLAVRGMASLQSSLIIYSERTGYLAKIGMGVGLASIGISALFIWLNGALGAAQAVFVSAVLRFVVTWAIARRLVALPWL